MKVTNIFLYPRNLSIAKSCAYHKYIIRFAMPGFICIFYGFCKQCPQEKAQLAFIQCLYFVVVQRPRNAQLIQ